MQHETTPLTHPHWGHPIEDIDAELMQLALVCGTRLLEPGVMARVMHNDTLVCDHDNPRAFEKMRQLLMMHYVVTERAIEALGAEEALAMENTIRQRLQARFAKLIEAQTESL
jgi:hypothetical protein